MNSVSHLPRKPVTALIKDMLDGWRKIKGWSQSTMAAEVVAAHKQIDGERVAEIFFEETRPGRDLTHCQRINMQRIYRWLENDDGPGHMPVNFLPSILAALPVDLRVQLANDILAPCGLTAQAATAEEGGEFDPIKHLEKFLVEFPEAKQAMMKMAHCRSPHTIRTVIKELDDVERVTKEARKGLEALAQQTGVVVRVA